MKIVKLIAKPITLPLKQPFKIALGTQEEYNGVILKIETDKGITGFGEASPSARITGETTGTVIDVIENKIMPVIIGENPLLIEKIMDEIESTILYNSSAKCAVDIALYDILGKYTHLPLKTLLGGFKEKIITSITIGMKSIKATVKEARGLINEGVKVLKVKIGENPIKDVEKIRTLRKEIGKIKLRVDANQGYNVKEAIWVLKKIEPYEIEFIEQPVAWWNIQGLKTVKDNVDIPVMADESLHSKEDAINLIRQNACDSFNIKLMKSGGIHNAIKIARIAEGAGIPCMLGCMSETKISVTAATHLALALKNIKYADLDGHLMLKKDIVKGGVITKNGENKVTNQEGLGVQLNSKLFKT
ncbi:dipeptide epimerase [candidate division WOR-3 bacterium]|nr:dipeptide epimerase [candidate division WOR-3 bacterium]